MAPGLFVNGQLTVTENSADLGGMQNAYAALLASLREDESAVAASPTGATPAAVTVAPPFTPQQRFFIAAAT